MNTINYSWWYETLNQVIFQNWLGWYVDAQTDINKFVYETFKLIIFASNRTEANFPGDIKFQLKQYWE
jgi:hypothetical protein